MRHSINRRFRLHTSEGRGRIRYARRIAIGGSSARTLSYSDESRSSAIDSECLAFFPPVRVRPPSTAQRSDEGTRPDLHIFSAFYPSILNRFGVLWWECIRDTP